jgi:hypothetical protein
LRRKNRRLPSQHDGGKDTSDQREWSRHAPIVMTQLVAQW